MVWHGLVWLAGISIAGSGLTDDPYTDFTWQVWANVPVQKHTLVDYHSFIICAFAVVPFEAFARSFFVFKNLCFA